MQTEQATTPAFRGKKDQKELAEQLFRLFQMRGRFFSQYAPIRITLAQLTEFMTQQQPGEKDWSSTIDAALSASSDVFARAEEDGEVVFTTTRDGHAKAPEPAADASHTLAQRFATPQPKRQQAPPRRPIVREPVAPQPEQPVAAAPSIARRPEPKPVETPVEVPAAPTVPDVAPPKPSETISVAAASDEELAEAIRQTLAGEMNIARWGDSWMMEDRVQRFSRGDLRRIEDFLREQDNIATDAEIVQDVLGVRQTADEYAATRFAVNFRLSRETREFEYVGTDVDGVWTLANAPSVGTTKRKPSEIGQDYRFLLDYRTPDEGLEEGLIEHVLSFYEYIYGVLPLNASMATLMPAHGFQDQRAARLTFESPQTNETVVAELRFPTGNRGGFIAGLEDFFADNLVPGAVITIEKTDRSNHFLLEYFQMSGEDRKLLSLDERKGKYAFRSTTFYCAIQDDFVLSENRFPRLADAKPLDDRMRRRPEQVVAATFERVGENVGSPAEPRYWAVFIDLLAAANIERPISAEFLRDILTSGTYPEFTADESTEDAFFYQPAS